MAKVLVVDDAPEQRALLEVRLRQAGHLVVSVSSAEDALRVLSERGAPDVALLDVLMPGMSGLELLARMRVDPASAHVPVIFLSGRVQPEDVAAARALGAAYLTKPIIVNAVLRAIEDATALAPAVARLHA